MFKKLNIEEKINISQKISQATIWIITSGSLIILNLKQINLIPSIIIVLLASILAMVSEIIRNWINNTLSSNIYGDIVKTSAVSKDISIKINEQGQTINKHIQLLKSSITLLNKLKTASQKTRTSALTVAKSSEEVFNLSGKEQQSVQSNIRKMNTLKQKIEIIAELILELSEHTQQIGSIIGVVEDITEQTNMLALNAAVEAARAGEHGKGFAVVASEIRKLADECKQATTKITSLIYDIQQATNSTVMATEEGTKEIESGVELAHHIEQSITTLRNTINDTVKSVDCIVKDSDQQLECTNDVYSFINQLDEGLNESSENIKQNLKTLQSLLEVSDSLKENIVGNNQNKTYGTY